MGVVRDNQSGSLHAFLASWFVVVIVEGGRPAATILTAMMCKTRAKHSSHAREWRYHWISGGTWQLPTVGHFESIFHV
jgi:hypothetical protein